LGTLSSLTVVCLVVLGPTRQLSSGLANLSFDQSRLRDYADVVASKWILANTAADTIVMARNRTWFTITVDATWFGSRRVPMCSCL
jgi:hypothetical protein